MKTSKALSKEELQQLDKEVLVDTVLSLNETVSQLSQNNEILLDALKLSRSNHFSKKSEINETIDFKQLSLDYGFNEAEEICDEIKEEVRLSEAVPRKIKVKGKKRNDLSKITNYREENIELSKEELDTIFTEGNYKRLPDEIVQKLQYHKAYYEAVTYRIHLYCAKDSSKCDTSIVRAPFENQLFEKSIVTSSLLSNIICNKYVNALPLYRQSKELEQSNIFIDRTNMANWIIKSYKDYLIDLEKPFKEELLKSEIIHADETTLRCSKDCKEREKNYMWVYRSHPNEGDKSVIIFDYQKDRKKERPKEFLADFKGTLVCDGYGAYHSLDEQMDIAGCWVHGKRKFTAYLKSVGNKTDSAEAQIALNAQNRISELFHEEHSIANLSAEEHYKKRQELLKPLVDEFFVYLNKSKEKVLDKSAVGQAISYCLSQEKYLRTFLKDGCIPLDNNAAERAIRPFTIGRKNWVMIDSINGAKASAMIYSLIESAKAAHLKIEDYLNYLFETLRVIKNEKDYKEKLINLLPWSDELPEYLKLD